MSAPSFKDLLQQDVGRVFLNLEEFGERHRVNGRPMTILLDDMENVEREKKQKSSMDGLHTRQVLFYVSAAEFGGPLPAQDTYLNLDGGTYRTVDATDECGVYAITLEANRSRCSPYRRTRKTWSAF